MACKYTYKGKTYEAWEFDDVLKAMNPIEAAKYMPAVLPVPDAPFISDSNNKSSTAYLNLLMKKALSAAIDNGQSFVSWTTGEQQADRYNLAKKAKVIVWNEDDRGLLNLYEKESDEIGMLPAETVPREKLKDYLGVEMAERLLAVEPDTRGDRHLKGDDLSVQPSWTKTMYGNSQGLDGNSKPSLILQAANELARKFNGKTGTVKLSIGEQPALFITPEMRAKILDEGMPLFSYAGQRAADADKTALARAVEMEQKGIDSETIRKETGWFLGMDDKWRFEIDDSKANLKRLFADLNIYAKKPLVRARAIRSLKDNPNKARIMYINDNIIDILSKLEKVDGFVIKC
jgi:hypothetical protein